MINPFLRSALVANAVKSTPKNLTSTLKPQPTAVGAPSDAMPTMRASFRTEHSGSDGYWMKFKFRDLAELHQASREWQAARAAAPVSGQGASIDTPEFQALLPADMTQWKRQEICQFIDSRPRSEDSRAKVLEEAYQAMVHRGWTDAASVIRALASTPPKADNE